MTKLIRFFVNRPLIINVITLFILIAGFSTYQRLQKQAFPPVDEGGISLITNYPGASPEDVELNVTIPIEDKLKTIEGIKDYISHSYEGYCSIWVSFDPDESDQFTIIKDNIRRAMDNIKNFPREVKERPRMYEWGGKYVEVVRIGIQGKNISEKELQSQVKELKNLLKESPYVSKIDESGIRDREIHIKIDLQKMNEKYISFEDIIKAIESQNIQVTSGTLKSYIAARNIVTLSHFENLLDVKNVIIRSSFDGKKIVLSDIAQVVDTFEHRRQIHHFNGNQGIILDVYKKQRSSIIKASDNIKKIISSYNHRMASKGSEASVIIDFSTPTRSRLKIVFNNALIGLALVILILFLFMNFKNAFWTALGIPFSICFCLIFLPFFNVTINSVSLLGLIIVLGMIVDDAIVVSENIYRHRLSGNIGLGTTVGATKEVGFAVLTTVLTTITAFLPLFFMKGVTGSYTREIPIIISLVLIGSLFESLFILPGHTSHTMKKTHKILFSLILGTFIGAAVSRYYQFSSFFIIVTTIATALFFVVIFLIFYKDEVIIKEKPVIRALKKGYSYLLRGVLKFRWIMIFLFLAIFAAGFFLFSQMKFEMFPDIEPNLVTLRGEVKGGLSLEYTRDQIKKLEQHLLTQYNRDDLFAVVSKIGIKGYKEKFEIVILLSSQENRPLKAVQLESDLKRIMDQSGLFQKIQFEKQYIGSPMIGSDVSIEIASNDEVIRNNLTDIVVKDLNSIDGIYDIQRSDQLLKNEINVIPRYDIASKFRVTANNIAKVTKIAYDGYIVTHIQTPEEKIPYRILLDDLYRQKIETLNQLKVLNQVGKLIPVRQMVQIKQGQALTQIKHFKGLRTTTIHCELDIQKISPQQLYSNLNQKYQKITNDYPGTRIDLGGSAEFSAEAMNDLNSTLLIAVIGIFMLLIFLFQSVTQPLIIMLVIPFGVFGVVFSFYGNGMNLSFMGMMGIIGLTGVVINDSLVMVEYINQLKKQLLTENGKSLPEIILQGAVTRLRPVMLTTLTTFGGLLPTAYGLGGKDSMVLPAAMALCWGIVFGTFITLIIVPTFYLMENDIRQLLGKKIPDLFKRRAK